MDSVVIGGSRLEFFQEVELRAASRLTLRDHAEKVSRALGFAGKSASSPPEGFEELVAWVLAAQRLHLEPPSGLARADHLRRSFAGSSGLSRSRSVTPPPTTQALNGGLIVSDAHSRLALLLARQQPLLAAAISQEVLSGLQKLHAGLYGVSLDVAQRQLAEDIYAQLCSAKVGSFRAYRDQFLNFSVAVGPMAYAGSTSCFSYKVTYPTKWTYISESACVTMFFTLKDAELRGLTGSLAYEEMATSSPLSVGARALGDDAVALYAPLAADYAVVSDVRLPISTELELRRMDRMSLQERAEMLFRNLGPGVVAMRPPEGYEELLAWVLRVQHVHLESLRPASLRAVEASRDAVVLADGIRLPVFAELELMAMDRLALREHVALLYTKLGDRITFGMPSLDEDLVAWVLRVQQLYLMPYHDGLTMRGEDYTTITTSPLGDKVETKTYKDIYGDDVTTKTVIDRFGDKTETTIVRDRSPLARVRSGLDSSPLVRDRSPLVRDRSPVRRSAADDLFTDRVRYAKRSASPRFGPLTKSVLRNDDALWRRL